MSPESTIDRTLWLANVLAAIAQFASEEFQRSAWVSFNGPDGASFEEACNLLGDFGLDDALGSSSSPYQLRPSEQLVLQEFWGLSKITLNMSMNAVFADLVRTMCRRSKSFRNRNGSKFATQL